MEPFRQPNSLQRKTWLPKEFLVQDSLVAAMLDLSQLRNTKNTIGKIEFGNQTLTLNLGEIGLTRSLMKLNFYRREIIHLFDFQWINTPEL